jgi:preprotein translocase subunit SecY
VVKQFPSKDNIVSIPKGANTGTSELKSKFLWTFLLLAIYRVGVHLPIPGVDGSALADFFANAQNTLFGLFDMFSGGGLKNLSIFALGIMPYISASSS